MKGAILRYFQDCRYCANIGMLYARLIFATVVASLLVDAFVFLVTEVPKVDDGHEAMSLVLLVK